MEQVGWVRGWFRRFMFDIALLRGSFIWPGIKYSLGEAKQAAVVLLRGDFLLNVLAICDTTDAVTW